MRSLVFLVAALLFTALCWGLGDWLSAKRARSDALSSPDPLTTSSGTGASSVPIPTADERTEDEWAAREAAVPVGDPSPAGEKATDVVVAHQPMDLQRARDLEFDEFVAVHKRLSVEELETQYKQSDAELKGLVTPLYEMRLAAGHYEVIGYGDRLSNENVDRNKLVRYQFEPTGRPGEFEIRKIELLEQECPQEYAMLRKCIWLVDEIERRSSVDSE